MKNRSIFFIIIVTVITIILLFHNEASAAAPSTIPSKTNPSPTTVIDKLKQIEILKEKIATKVAEIRQSEKSAVSGTVKSATDKSLTVSDKKAEQTISYSEDTIFFKMTDGKKSDPLGKPEVKKIKAGDNLAVLGYFDSSHSTFSAKYIYLYTAPLYITGKIAQKDSENYTISVSQPQGNVLVDIETYTKISVYNTKSGLLKGGFSKLAEGNTVHIFATANPKEENRVSAVKIISFNFGTLTPTLAVEKEASPTAKPTIE